MIDAANSGFRHIRRVEWGDCDPARIAYSGRIPDFALEAIEQGGANGKIVVLTPFGRAANDARTESAKATASDLRTVGGKPHCSP